MEYDTTNKMSNNPTCTYYGPTSLVKTATLQGTNTTVPLTDTPDDIVTNLAASYGSITPSGQWCLFDKTDGTFGCIDLSTIKTNIKNTQTFACESTLTPTGISTQICSISGRGVGKDQNGNYVAEVSSCKK